MSDDKIRVLRSVDDLSGIEIADEEKVIIVNQNEVFTEMLHKEIDVLQGIIKRMADNSFSIKKWAAVLVFVAILFKQHTISPAYGAIPLLVFWYLDSHYLRLERMFIQLQDDKVEERTRDCPKGMYDFNPHHASKKPGFFSVAFSWSQAGFYLPLLAMLLIAAR